MTEVAEVTRALGVLDDAANELRAVRDALATALFKIEVSDEMRRWLVPPEHRPMCPLNNQPCTSWTCLVDVCVDESPGDSVIARKIRSRSSRSAVIEARAGGS